MRNTIQTCLIQVSRGFNRLGDKTYKRPPDSALDKADEPLERDVDPTTTTTSPPPTAAALTESPVTVLRYPRFSDRRDDNSDAVDRAIEFASQPSQLSPRVSVEKPSPPPVPSLPKASVVTSTSAVTQNPKAPANPFIFEPTSIDDDCEFSTHLVSWGLVINKVAKAIICRNCGKGIIPSSLKTHVYENHKEDFPGVDDYSSLGVEELKVMYEDLIDFSVTSRYVPTVLPAMPVSYITTKRGWTCVSKEGREDCFYSATMEETLKKHHRTEHRGDDGYWNEESWVQTLYGETLIRYYPVTLPTIVPNNIRALLETVKRQEEEMDSKAITSMIPEKQRPAFFRSIRLYEFLEKYEVRQVVRIGESARRGVIWEERIREVVIHYFAEVNRSLGAKDPHTVVAERLSVKDAEGK